MLVSDIVRNNARHFPKADAIVSVDPGWSCTWAELDVRTDRLANAFDELGLCKGDRAAIYAPNCREYIEFFFACAKSGVIGAAVNTRLADHEVQQYLSYVEPEVVLVHADLSRSAASWLGRAGLGASRRRFWW